MLSRGLFENPKNLSVLLASKIAARMRNPCREACGSTDEPEHRTWIAAAANHAVNQQLIRNLRGQQVMGRQPGRETRKHAQTRCL